MDQAVIKDEAETVRDLPRLKDAIRKVKLAEAERADVIVELREAERVRLEVVLQKLEGVVGDLPADDDQFELAIVPGNTPKLWVDVTGFVVMGRDKRTYRFLKDTRLGRVVLAESTDADEIAERITEYVAARIVARERALAAEELRPAREVAPTPAGGPAKASIPAIAEATPVRPSTARVVVAFVTGLVIGGLAVAAYFGATPTP
ncbi:MAG: hypothetical protein R3D02_07550 [Hyphomicrobiales bacterium]